MNKHSKADTLADVNKEIRRISRLINDRVYRKEFDIDPTGLYTQAIARVAGVAERTNPHYNSEKPRLTTVKAKSLKQGFKRLEELQTLERTTRTLTAKGNAEWYAKRIAEVNERTGLQFNRKTYDMLLRLQHTAGNDVWASSQLVDFFGTLANIPKATRVKMPIDITSYDSIVRFLRSTSFPYDELQTYLSELDKKNFNEGKYRKSAILWRDKK